MQSMNEIVSGMRPDEKTAYLEHQRMRALQEEERMQELREENIRYKRTLIGDILRHGNGRYTEGQLKSKSIRFLEMLI